MVLWNSKTLKRLEVSFPTHSCSALAADLALKSDQSKTWQHLWRQQGSPWQPASHSTISWDSSLCLRSRPKTRKLFQARHLNGSLTEHTSPARETAFLQQSPAHLCSKGNHDLLKGLGWSMPHVICAINGELSHKAIAGANLGKAGR